jgi:hypothetical protein
MQLRVLHSQDKPTPQHAAKEKRVLRPTTDFHEGKKIYANELGQEFFSRSFPTREEYKNRHTIEVLQLGDGKPIIRYSAKIMHIGKALTIAHAESRSWGASGYRAMRIIRDEAISLAQSLGAKTIYIKPKNFKLASLCLSLGFKEIPNLDYMELKVPGGASNP